MVQGLLAVFYNLGDGDYNLTLPHSPLSDGEWHEVELDRFGREFTLRLDSGGGRRQAVGSPGQSQEIIVDPSLVMLGNSFPSGHNRSFLGTRLGWGGGRGGGRLYVGIIVILYGLFLIPAPSERSRGRGCSVFK